METRRKISERFGFEKSVSADKNGQRTLVIPSGKMERKIVFVNQAWIWFMLSSKNHDNDSRIL